MKNIIYSLIAIMAIGSCKIQQQHKTYTQTTFRVEGNCEMCKKRIENAVMSLSGVKKANWDTTTKMLNISYDASKMTEDKIHEELSKVGHATSKLPADERAYQKLHTCCKYKD